MMIAHLSGPCSDLLCFNPLAMSLPTLKICSASSLVGHIMIALGPCVSRWTPPRRCNSGITYASVFPEPVRAIPRTSRGGVASDNGMVDLWIGVGALKPLRLNCFASGSVTPDLLARQNNAAGASCLPRACHCSIDAVLEFFDLTPDFDELDGVP